jgi:hypothetical protein
MVEPRCACWRLLLLITAGPITKLCAGGGDTTEILEQLFVAADCSCRLGGVAAQERAARAVAAAVRTWMPGCAWFVKTKPGYASFVYCDAGLCLVCQKHPLATRIIRLGTFCKAIEYHPQDLTIPREVGDRAGECQSSGSLSNAYQSLGDYSKAIEYLSQHLAIAKELGNRAGEGHSFGSLVIAYQSLGDCSKAIKFHAQHLAIAKEVGKRAGEGAAYGNLGSVYRSLGDYSKAIEYLSQHLAIAKEVGDRAGEGKSYGNLRDAYRSLGCWSSSPRAYQPPAPPLRRRGPALSDRACVLEPCASQVPGSELRRAVDDVQHG